MSLKPVPGENASAPEARTYQRFTTERPTFAEDDLLAQLQQGGATVSATPLTQDRGILVNLLISVAPMLLLFAFWYWLFRRGQSAMSGMFRGVGAVGASPWTPIRCA